MYTKDINYSYLFSVNLQKYQVTLNVSNVMIIVYNIHKYLHTHTHAYIHIIPLPIPIPT